MTGPTRSLFAHEHATAIAADGLAPAVTYAELVDLASRRAAQLEPDAVVLLRAENSREYIPWFLGAIWAGAWVMPFHPATPPRELDLLAARSGASLVIGGLVDGLPSLPLSLPPPRRTSPARAEGGVLLQSSGTTSHPRIVRRNAASLRAVAENVREALALTPDDVIAAAIPMGHSYGVENALLGPLAAGSALLLFDVFDPARLREAFRQSRVSVLPGVPFFFEAIAREPGPRGGLRLAYSAGAPLPSRVADDFERAFGLRLGQLYGATEIGSVTFADPAAASFRHGSVGSPMNGVRILIQDPAGRLLPPGAEGEVLVRAPSMLDAYLDAPADLADNAFFRTGDLGRLDEHANLFLSGRLKFIVDVGGLKVNPLEVERVLIEHPDIAECLVLPLPVSETVTRLRAIVVPRRTLTPAEVRHFARERLAAHKVPRVIEFREAIPRTPMGKVRRDVAAASP